MPVSTWVGNLSSVAALRPLEALRTSSIVAMSRPTEAPKATASLVAARAVADRKLLANFRAWAIPGRSPTRRVRSLSPASTGATAAQAATGPAYITDRVRARAPATPPETGAST